MRNTGIIAAIVGTIFGGISNMLQKKASIKYEDNYLALVYQYVSMAFRALIIAVIYSQIQGVSVLPDMSSKMWLLAMGVSVIGYIGIACMFKAFDYLSAGIALVIANLSVFLMYFANLSLFPGTESLSIAKIIIAIVFFIVIAQFLIDHDSAATQRKLVINTKTLYAVVTAISRTVFFVGNNYFVKTGTMDPIHSMFVTETMILVFAFLWYLLKKPRAFTVIKKGINRKYTLIFGAIGLTNVIYATLTYYGYQTNPANLINFIKLFAIVTTSVLSWIFLKDYLTRKQSILLTISMVLLVVFLFVA